MQSSITNSIHEIEQWITRISSDVALANNYAKNDLLIILYKFHVLAAKVSGYGLFGWEKAFEHVNQSIELASEIKAHELRATSLYLSGDFRLAQHRPVLAINDFNNALLCCPNGAIYSGLAIAKAMTSSEDILVIQKLLDKAEQYISSDTCFNSLTYNKPRYLMDRADTLIIAGRFKTALEVLDDAEEIIDNQKRQEYINILRAESYIKKKKPEYEQAILLMQEVLENNKRAPHTYHIQYVDRLYKALQESPFANSPDVADIGLMLKDFKNGTKI